MAQLDGTSAFHGAYNSFSGVDIKAVFGKNVIGELQAISYSVTREKAPVYTMGSADPRSFSRGKRGIAGTLILMMFDRHALLGAMGGAMGDGSAQFLSDKDDLRPDFTVDASRISENATANDIISASTRQVDSAVEDQETNFGSVSSDQEIATPWYSDQLLPFDVTLAGANEYGSLAVMRIYGVEILNEGYGISIDDIQSAQQMTYVARTVVGWRSLGKFDG